jgi:DNA repair protein RadC
VKKKIKWATDRPREKLDTKGASSLTDHELIAVLLGTGTANNHVFDISNKLLGLAENSLSKLVLLPISDMMTVRGIGHAKAVHLKAAFEFARRAQFEVSPVDLRITSSQAAFKVLRPHLAFLSQEEFWVLFLNRRSNFIDKTCLSQGGLNSTVVDPRVLFRLALHAKASSIIVAHNHPSGNLNPSEADIDLTKKISSAGKLLDIQLVDHLIISGNKYCSFADSGLL